MASKHYAKELMAEVNADREAHGKKPFDDEPPTAPKKRKDNTSKKKMARRKKEKTKTVTKSITAVLHIVRTVQKRPLVGKY